MLSFLHIDAVAPWGDFESDFSVQFDFTMQEDADSGFEQCRQKKREALLEIYKYLDAVPAQSPLPPKLLQQLLVMVQASFTITTSSP